MSEEPKELSVQEAEQRLIEIANNSNRKLRSESDELRDLLFRRAAQDEVSRCCKFKGLTGAQVLEQIAKERNIKFSYSDTFDTILSTPGYNTITEILEFAERHPDLADQRTLPKDSGDTEGKPKAAQAPTCKADLKNPKEKSDYIGKFGYDAFIKLAASPISRNTNPATMTAADYLSLPPAKRAEIAGKVGPSGISQILKRKEQI